MKKGIWYKITVGNDEFECGDLIKQNEDGSIITNDWGGWIDANAVEESMEDVRYEIAREWALEYLRKHTKRLIEMQKDYGIKEEELFVSSADC